MVQSPIHTFNYIVITLQIVHTQEIVGGKRKNILDIDIRNWCIPHNIHLSISHVAGFLNVEANELSRGINLNKDFEMALDIDIFKEIVDRFGKPEIDLFASRLNHKLDKHISFKPDPGGYLFNILD